MKSLQDIKILFLCMSTQDEHYNNLVACIKETWGKKIINGEWGNNVQLLFYDGNPYLAEHYLDKDYCTLHLKCEDDINNTFKKTYYALNIIQNNFDFDYVFRTNTSTYVNVELALALIEYIERSEQQDIIWTSELLSLIESCCPFPMDLYGRGNGLILSRTTIQRILDNGLVHLYSEMTDDVAIGNIINSYWESRSKNSRNYLKSFTHGWYNCVVEDDFTSNHQLCEYYNRNSDWNFICQFVTIQIKQYYHRYDETENCKELYSIIENQTYDNINEYLEKIIVYSENPSIFLGSILGYCTYNTWLNVDKSYLWELQANNKADNDPYKEKFLNKIWC